MIFTANTDLQGFLGLIFVFFLLKRHIALELSTKNYILPEGGKWFDNISSYAIER